MDLSYKKLATLLTTRGIREHGLAFAYGKRHIAEILTLAPKLAKYWVCSHDHSVLTSETLPCVRLGSGEFNKLDVIGTDYPLLVFSPPPIEAWDARAPAGREVFLPLQNPENVGASLRACAAFGVTKVILSADAACPFLPKSIRAAGPAVVGLTIVRGPLLCDFPAHVGPMVALTQHGIPLQKSSIPQPFILVVGQEGRGLTTLPRHVMESIYAVSIPMEPAVESLNAQTSLAIALSYIYSQ